MREENYFLWICLIRKFNSVPNKAVELIQKNSSLFIGKKKKKYYKEEGRSARHRTLKCVSVCVCVCDSVCDCETKSAGHIKSLTLLPVVWIDGVTIKEEIWNSKGEWFDWLLSRFVTSRRPILLQIAVHTHTHGSGWFVERQTMTTIIQYWDSIHCGRVLNFLWQQFLAWRYNKLVCASYHGSN
jgi:hypothetical protein